MDLSIIIVSWNVRDRLRDNLNALYRSEGDFSFEVFVVDNDSGDGSAEMARDEFLRVKLIANRENLGFARANNQAIREAQGEFVLLLNPDMRVSPDTLVSMIAWMRKNPQAGVAGCRLVDERGETIRHVRRFPAVTDQLAIALKLPHLFPGILNRYLHTDFDYNRPARVDSIRGSFFLIRRATIGKIGALDERYFIWFEEVDYCRRVRGTGGEVWYTPAATCVDLVGRSAAQVKGSVRRRIFFSSLLAYFRKWHPAWQYYLLRLAHPLGMAIAAAGEMIKFEKRAKT